MKKHFASICSRRLLCTLALFSQGSALASPLDMSYGGRLANSQGIAVSGPVNLEVRFYRTQTGGTSLNTNALQFPATPMEDGVFDLTLSNSGASAVGTYFDGLNETWIEVKDTSNNVTYPRQRLTSVPYAMRVPVDSSSLAFNASGQLTVNPSWAPTTLYSGTSVVGTSDGTATPAQGTIRGANAIGTNISGAPLIIAAGNGTGLGSSGSVRIQTAPGSTTGATANTLSTALIVSPNGSVGIGIGDGTPSAKLQVNGTIAAKGLKNSVQTLKIPSGTTSLASDGSGVFVITVDDNTESTIGTITGCNSGAVAQGQTVIFVVASLGSGSGSGNGKLTFTDYPISGALAADQMVLRAGDTNPGLIFEQTSPIASNPEKYFPGSTFTLLCTNIKSVLAWVEVARSGNTN